MIGREEVVVRRSFTPEEKIVIAQDISDASVKLDDLEERYREVRAEWTDKIKSVKASIKKSVVDLRKGYTEESIMCDMIPNLDAGVMEFYDDKVTLVSTRRLLPHERQEVING